MIIDERIFLGWFLLAGPSTLYVVWDNFVPKNTEKTFLKWAAC